MLQCAVNLRQRGRMSTSVNVKLRFRCSHIVLILVCAARVVHSAPLGPLDTAPEDPEVNALPKQDRGEEGEFFQGDIRLRPGEDPYNIFRIDRSRQKKQVRFHGEESSGDLPEDAYEMAVIRVWPDNRIPYKFENDLRRTAPEIKQNFDQAIREWNRATCIQFVEAEMNDTDYILLTNRRGCSAHVGKVGGPQEVSINANCSNVGHAMHELGHVLGLWHEHSRPDRDAYIRIHFMNIKETKMGHFGIISQDVFEAVPDVGYDIESIMHYGPYAFAKNERQPTIEVVEYPPHALQDCLLDLGQRNELSYLDKLRANKLYQCTDMVAKLEGEERVCPTTETTPTEPPTTTLINTGTAVRVWLVDATNEAIECNSNGCRKHTCVLSFFTGELYCSISSTFNIHLTVERKNTKIKSGDTIVMQSFRPNRWIDCNTGVCTITGCAGNEVNPNISSNISECDQHLLVIYAIGKDDGKTVRTRDQVIFKNLNGTHCLNCQGKRCELVNDPAHLAGDDIRAGTTPLQCQKFSLQTL